MFGRKKPLSRSDLLTAATKAQKRRQWKKALDLYRQLLRDDPGDAQLMRRAAPVLARLKEPDEAWKYFQAAAKQFAKGGFSDKAIGVYHESAHYLPQKPEAWLAIAETHVDNDRPSDAVQALLQGRRHFRGRRQRAGAIRLLSRAHDIEPGELAPALDLARLLRRTGQRRPAYDLLEQQLRLTPPSRKRRIRRAQFRIRPTPAALWRWMRGR